MGKLINLKPYEILIYRKFSNNKAEIKKYKVLFPDNMTIIVSVNEANRRGQDPQRDICKCDNCPMNNTYVPYDDKIDGDIIKSIRNDVPCKDIDVNTSGMHYLPTVILDKVVCEGEDSSQLLCLSNCTSDCTYFHIVITKFPCEEEGDLYPYEYKMSISNPLSIDQWIISEYERLNNIKIKEEIVHGTD